MHPVMDSTADYFLVIKYEHISQEKRRNRRR
jgi:hypothetical protein